MDDEQLKLLKEAGVDTADGLERFMDNKAMFEKFLLRFVENPTYEKYLEALKAQDCKACFETTHSLKGNTGTLALTALYTLFCEQTDYFREGDYEKGAAMAKKVDEEYKRMTGEIKKILG